MGELIIWVYILRGENGKYYTGITNDIARRLKEHRSGSSRSTRKYGEIELIWTHTVEERKQARELEILIKRKGARRFIKTYGEGQLEWPKGNQGIKTKGSGSTGSRSKEKGQEMEKERELEEEKGMGLSEETMREIGEKRKEKKGDQA